MCVPISKMMVAKRSSDLGFRQTDSITARLLWNKLKGKLGGLLLNGDTLTLNISMLLEMNLIDPIVRRLLTLNCCAKLEQKVEAANFTNISYNTVGAL
ncbi:hypothetical protein L1987_01634 [Smallanthus sonchifolius]|uniref:Uncharacterized protein n=1 Tax=Smallanthus sonchifolius TaxID=185202 RepID=A0ACB9K5K4_9ASTR|nr:hypothetical protein L1987_01634 [Smallanthus sonchifolius]